MPPLTESQLRTLLADPACPWGSDLRATVTVRRISLPDLLSFASGRLDTTDDLEAQLDELMVASVGARHFELIDPWSWPKRQVLRLAGKPSGQQVAYEVDAGLNVP